MEVIAFEPDQREFAKLKNTDHITYLNCLVHNVSQDLSFNISREEGKCSIFKPNKAILSHFPNAERFDTVEEKRIWASQTKDLDSIAQENSIRDVDFIKLDTEGSELIILEGCKKEILSSVFGLHVEVSFLELREKQCLFHDVNKFLSGEAFNLIDLRRAYWKRKDFYDFPGKGALIFGDVLYFKEIGMLIETLKKKNNRAYGTSKIYKGILTCMIYRIFDYAMSLARMAFQENFLNEEEFKKLTSIIEICARDTLPHFWGRAFLYKLLSRICKRIQPKSHLGWADGDQWIGNIKDV